MVKRCAVGLAVAAVSLFGASAASAATEFGTGCTANTATGVTQYTLVQLAQGGAQLTAPVSGVVTRWKLNLVPGPYSIPQQLEVFRPTANPAQLQVVGESGVSTVLGGANSFDTRIPIQAGDRIGLFGGGETGTLFCETKAASDTIGVIEGNPTAGSTATLINEASGYLVPAVAAIEPDVDGDGYGDETQDQCPQSAATQAACPTVSLDVIPHVRKTSILLLVSVSSEARVAVTGQVKWGFKPKPKSKKAQASKHNLIIGLNGGTKTVAPGQIARFVAKLPKSVMRRLRGITPKQSLKAKLTATATDSIGRKTAKRVAVKLKGQKHG